MKRVVVPFKGVDGRGKPRRPTADELNKVNRERWDARAKEQQRIPQKGTKAEKDAFFRALEFQVRNDRAARALMAGKRSFVDDTHLGDVAAALSLLEDVDEVLQAQLAKERSREKNAPRVRKAHQARREQGRPAQQLVSAAFARNPGATIEELAEAAGLSVEQTKRHLANLKR